MPQNLPLALFLPLLAPALPTAPGSPAVLSDLSCTSFAAGNTRQGHLQANAENSHFFPLDSHDFLVLSWKYSPKNPRVQYFCDVLTSALLTDRGSSFQ